LKQRLSVLTLAAHLVSVALVLIHGTGLSAVAAMITLFLFAAFAAHSHRSLAFATGTMLLQTIYLPAAFTELITKDKPGTSGTGRRQGWRKNLLIFPLVLMSCFLVVYLIANKGFASMMQSWFTTAIEYLGSIFENFSWSRTLFVLLGAYTTGALIIRTRIAYFSKREAPLSDDLIRIRNADNASSFGRLVSGFASASTVGTMGLRYKYKVGLISLVMLNLLLLLVNITDINYIWLGGSANIDTTFSELVHEGTGTLILSIIMAIAVVLIFFDGNLNFYKRNKSLKLAAYVWIAQNIFLVFSVFLRDYYYISHHGLAYKRIGVLFFLALVLTGLISVIIKIACIKTGYFLFRVNGNAVLGLLLIGAVVNWDILIAKYNIKHVDSIRPDIVFLMNLSDQTLPILYENWMKLEPYTRGRKFWYGESRYIKSITFDEVIAARQKDYLDIKTNQSWLSFNLTDHQTKNYFTKQIVAKH